MTSSTADSLDHFWRFFPTWLLPAPGFRMCPLSNDSAKISRRPLATVCGSSQLIDRTRKLISDAVRLVVGHLVVAAVGQDETAQCVNVEGCSLVGGVGAGGWEEALALDRFWCVLESVGRGLVAKGT